MAYDGTGTILTPDQRLRVFISSTPTELGAERDALRQAVQAVRLTPVMPDIGARPYSPQALYRAYIDQSDVFVGVYGAEYGEALADTGVSSLEHEYELAAGIPRLLYLKDVRDRDPRLDAFVERIQRDDAASYRPFTTALQLGELVRDDLALLLSERFGPGPAATPVVAVAPRPRPVPVPVTALVGRGDDLESVAALVLREEVRLVTLTGPGGIGKTRLAIDVSRAMADHFATVAYVPLAAVEADDEVLGAVATAMGVRVDPHQLTMDALVEAIGTRPVLLLLDNLEHLVACGPYLRRLLEQSPSLTILATSRVLLRVRGEYEFAVGPLPVPEPTADVSVVAQSPAVQLFVARAQEVNSRFRLDATNAADIAEICRRLDGLPLALELAAARTRLLTPASLLQRLGSRLDVLTDGAADLPERQRTLRATIEWSLNLLDAEQQRRFAQLAVFVGGWDIDAAAAVWEVDDSTALDHLSVLLDSSLVTAVPGESDVRFRMLQTLGAYAAERLAELPDAEDVSGRHAAWMVGQCRDANLKLQGRDHRQFTRRLLEEFENLRAAVEWLLAAGRIADVALIGWELLAFWWQQGLVREASAWMQQALRQGEDLDLDPRVAARLQFVVGALAGQMGDVPVAHDMLGQARQRLAELGDEEALGACLLLLSTAMARGGGLQEADATAAQAAGLLRAHGMEVGYIVALETRGTVAMVEGRLDDARRFHLAAQDAATQLGNDTLVAQTYNQLGFVELWSGDVAAARELLDKGLEGYLATSNSEGLALTLEGYATIALAEGEHRRAGLALAHAELLRERVGLPVWPPLEEAYEAALTSVRDALGEEQYAAVREEGRRMTRQAAIAAATGAVAAVP